MHVLSELRNPLFDTPDRQRALRALQIARILRENNGAKAWQAVKNMIDKAIAEHNASPRSQSQSSGYTSPPLRGPSSVPLEDPSNDNVRVYPAMGAIPSYTLQISSGEYTPDPITTVPRQIHPQPVFMQSMQPVQPMQAFIQPNWDDLNLTNINNIVGDMQAMPGAMPDFDFVGSLYESRRNGTNKARASGVIRSTTRMNLLQSPWKAATYRHGPVDELKCAPS
jgi:hypothetical protein